ncbi:alginate lyase-domain-containing protein [Mortierella sp. GBAus27b]|nr:hypothetical protein BGX31_005912 [Mortierella sp. GBA43]KAI8356894.1 alginate lyase-domain-containing protein [Mortierella sp. GBAus27b]
MRSSNGPVLPTNNAGSQFKDKPVNPSPINLGRITLRRVILLSGGVLFVYIIITTVFGSVFENDRGFPVVKQKERDPYVDIPNPLPNQGQKPDQGQPQEPLVIGRQPPAPAPPVPAPPVPAPPLQLVPIVPPPPPSNGGEQRPDSTPGAGSGTGDAATSEEDGDAADSSPQVEENVELLKAIKERKESPMSYTQWLNASRRERNYAIALIVREADLALRSELVYSVTNKNQTAPSNDIHDYLSLSKYYWPNPDKPNGLPYRRIDGKVNPEIETVRDYRLLRTMIREVHMMGMAYHFTGRKEYADKCAMRLKEWFLDEKTYMNPNINYGSLRKGEKLGARTGVLDMFTIFRVFDALHYLKQEPTWPQDLIPRLQDWFKRYASWLETSTLAKVERNGDNNHGTYYDVQVIGIYLFLGRVEDARAVAKEALHKRIDTQITGKGSQPEELARKTSWYYSVFNLQALMTLARWGDDLGVDMWNYEGPQGQSIKKAIDFLLPYALSGGEGWPVENWKGFDMTDYLKCLQIAWHIYGDEKYIEAIDVLGPKVQKDMDDGKIKTITTFMCDISTLLGATTRGGQGFIWHWCLT